MRKILVLVSAALLLSVPLVQGDQAGNLVSEVRAAIAAGDFPRGERLVAEHRAANGVTPIMLEALSWLGRGALAANRLPQADAYARETHELSLAALKSRGVDDEPRLPIALGAAIEVQAQAAALRGERSLAVLFAQKELETYANTSLYKRIQKNLNLLTLEGEPAPTLDLSEYLGPRPSNLAALRGQVVIVFFWAHWCPDCKNQGPVLETLISRYGAQGLTVVAPTQRFGYAARGATVSPDEERRYIEQIRNEHYAFLATRSVPLTEANHQRYGVSTTPTMVVVDRAGKIALYHPGQMTMAELEPVVQRLLSARAD